MANATMQTAAGTYPLVVDYSRSLDDVVAAGNYTYVNLGITEKRFPTVEGEPEVEAVLVHLGRTASDEDVLAELERRGLRPGTLFELAHFGEQHPEVWRLFPVAALGCSIRSWPRLWPFGRYRGYAALWEGTYDRGLRLDWSNGQWGAHYRFLAFRK